MFFILHKHCNLDKWKIYDYTLPQVVELMKEANKYIQFEITGRQLGSFGALGGLASPVYNGSTSSSGNDDNEYQEVTEDDVNALARVLGGG